MHTSEAEDYPALPKKFSFEDNVVPLTEEEQREAELMKEVVDLIDELNFNRAMVEMETITGCEAVQVNEEEEEEDTQERRCARGLQKHRTDASTACISIPSVGTCDLHFWMRKRERESGASEVKRYGGGEAGEELLRFGRTLLLVGDSDDRSRKFLTSLYYIPPLDRMKEALNQSSRCPRLRTGFWRYGSAHQDKDIL
ncbi:uncharacterized protein LOC127254466 [Andrographis paniculata]|uniref:uncharacterized protein LOC127254466 n=1 Tax=Andrographis paniculata TaxID=175694 RepID=UPI0021E95FEB|nr:uncharacterized protein LOC127254466 [Andrographis paniculata]XP_051135515.1 uncharacterized protein LOC127254466 [Andrographis paniculata]XP_051135516.1 uncharacterized protein LOC127254466 [Andrographis paniculata]XP_051135517.1 uncharacterized protein LOC127254466 [Andrographis paniculata]XP_051135518.1 uncharacterized protein LOC127254466 [Andrographis paniculata]XP_051135519.1 uncharacterized protein LOC127254466 [Andrographis paniculata]